MTLLDKINSAFQRKALTVKEKYCEALRSGDGDAILTAATAAGVSPQQLAADGEILDKAAALSVEVALLPKLEKAAATATQAANAAADELDRIIKPLEAKAESTAYESREADKNLRACRASVNALRGLYEGYPELLPRDGAPATIRGIWSAESKERDASKTQIDALARLQTAKERCEQLAQLVHNLRYRHPLAMPTPAGIFDPEQIAKDRPAAIEQGETQLAEAQTALAEAKRAAAKVGVDVSKI